MVEDAVGREQLAEHLEPWMETVRSDNSAKKSIDRYGRLFRLQHFWRVVFSRYAETARHHQPQLRRAFAAWLFPKLDGEELTKKVELVRKDLDCAGQSPRRPGLAASLHRLPPFLSLPSLL